MTYMATLEGVKTRVAVEESSPGRYRVVAGERAYLVDLLESRAGVFSLSVDGRLFEVAIDHDGRSDLFGVDINGDHFEIEMADERKRRPAGRSKGAPNGGRREIKAPMAGNVWKVQVAEGERVEVGQVLFILEAMKMENEIKSPIAGLLTSLSAQEGVPVFAGDPLCVVEAV